MSNIIRSTTKLALHLVRPYIKPHSIVIDATCGNGHDTLLLADEMTSGRLLAFDIQPEAITATEKLLAEAGYSVITETDCQTHHADSGISLRLILDSHENIDRYTEAAHVVLFNLGYLPGGDKSITTEPDSTLRAIEKALLLLQKDGLVCITMYSGHEEGSREKEKILDFARNLDSSDYHVAYVNLLNQPNNPPEVLLITKKK